MFQIKECVFVCVSACCRRRWCVFMYICICALVCMHVEWGSGRNSLFIITVQPESHISWSVVSGSCELPLLSSVSLQYVLLFFKICTFVGKKKLFFSGSNTVYMLLFWARVNRLHRFVCIQNSWWWSTPQTLPPTPLLHSITAPTLSNYKCRCQLSCIYYFISTHYSGQWLGSDWGVLSSILIPSFSHINFKHMSRLGLLFDTQRHCCFTADKTFNECEWHLVGRTWPKLEVFRIPEP